jgi:hypothetical protein
MAADNDIAMLKARITRLELQARRLKALLGTLVLAAVAVLAVGQAASRPSKVLRASSLVIEDGAGQERATLDETGLQIRWASTGQDKPHVCSLRPNGLSVLSPDGGSTTIEAPNSLLGGIRLGDNSGDDRMELNLARDGGPRITLKRRTPAIVRDWIANFPNRLQDPNGEKRKVPDDVADAMRSEDALVLGVTSLTAGATGVEEIRPEGSIVMFNTNGYVHWKVP